jgi:multicomponent Na+:H+ antiporter subunit D
MILPPQFIFLIGALFIPLFKGRLRTAYMLLLPVLAFFSYLKLEEGTYWTYSILNFDLTLVRADPMSLMFLSIFIIATFIAVVYNSHEKGAMEHFSGFLYAGSGVGVVMAGDLITFFIFWELLTVGAAFLLLVRRTAKSVGAAMRYLLVHIVGGLILFAGIVLHIKETGSANIAFDAIGLDSTASYLIFLGFGVNCGWPVIHAWITDTYPESTVGGIVFMATFTTKAAVYALMRGYPGEEALIWIGATMATFPIFYAVIENDLRRVLAYSMINQVGFMVVGIGIGTSLSMNGSAAHVYADILFKGLLFMSVGAVLYRTGKSKCTELGGLFKCMPFTAVCCMIGAASISAVPLFSGFATKSMIMAEAANNHHVWVWLILLFASAGVVEHAGIKIPFFAFFSHDSGIKVEEAPMNMRIAMGLAAVGCLTIGIFPNQTLYQILPFDAHYEVFTLAHVIGQCLLLLFAALAFTLLMLGGFYPAEMRAINIDSDWFYRRGGKWIYQICDRSLNGVNAVAHKVFMGGIVNSVCRFATEGPARIFICLLTPYWTIRGNNAGQQEALKNTVRLNIEKGALPIGITACLSVIVLALLFFF